MFMLRWASKRLCNVFCLWRSCQVVTILIHSLTFSTLSIEAEPQFVGSLGCTLFKPEIRMFCWNQISHWGNIKYFLSSFHLHIPVPGEWSSVSHDQPCQCGAHSETNEHQVWAQNVLLEYAALQWKKQKPGCVVTPIHSQSSGSFM